MVAARLQDETGAAGARAVLLAVATLDRARGAGAAVLPGAAIAPPTWR